MPKDFSLLRAQRAHSGIERQKAVRVARLATLRSVFFSLRGRLPRDQWRWAMVVAGSVFLCVVSLLKGNIDAGDQGSEWAGPSWLMFLWCVTVLCVVTLLCAKRLLDCERPVWLALTVAGPGLLLIPALAMGPHSMQPTLTVMAAYFALFALPALIACAVRGGKD